MKKIHSKLCISWLTSFFALTAALVADAPATNPTTQPQEKQNAAFNSRPLPSEKRTLMEQKRALEESERADENSLQGNIHQSVHRANDSKPKIMRTNGIFFPMDHHWIEAFPSSNIVKLEDGSEWNVAANEAYIIQSWRTGHQIVISPNYGWFTSYSYYLTNKSTNTYVQVTPFLGPVAFGMYTHWIVGMDFNAGHVYLTNGKGERTTWFISTTDAYLFKDWKINDCVIIGRNDSWMSAFSAFENILINVPMNHHVRARQF